MYLYNKLGSINIQILPYILAVHFMDIKSFYNNISKSEGYNIKMRDNLIERKGLKRLIAFDDRFFTVSRELSKYIKSNSPNKKLKMLDISCGDGVFESILVEKYRDKVDFYGVDISTNQIKKSQHLFTETIELDFDHNPLPYNSESFDLVLCSDVLEHLFYPEYVLKEAHRVLKKSGKAFITVPNVGALQIRLGLFFKGYSPMLNYPSNKPHIRFFNKYDITNLTNEYFRSIKTFGLSSLLFGKWNSGVDLIMPRILQTFFNKCLINLSLGLFFILEKK